MLCVLMAAAGSVLISGSHAWDFKLPKSLDSVPQLAERTFFNYTTVASSGSLAVINKTTTAYAAGIILASSFLAGTLIYNLEENRSSAKLSNRESDGFLSTFFSSDSASDDLTENDSDSEGSKKGRKRRKKKVDGNSEAVVCNDCETYCSNKYYYGDPYHSYDTPPQSADGATYAKRYVSVIQQQQPQSASLFLKKREKNRTGCTLTGLRRTVLIPFFLLIPIEHY